MQTTDLTVQQLANELADLWEKEYRAGNKATCTTIETTIKQLEQADQNAIVAQAEREALYAALTRLQDDKKRLSKQVDTAYQEGYADAMRAVTDHEQPTVQRYQSSAHFPGVEARH